MIEVEIESEYCVGCQLFEENERLRNLLMQNNITIPDPPAHAYACPALAQMLGLLPTLPEGWRC